MEEKNKNSNPDYILVIAKLINVIIILLLVIVLLIVIHFISLRSTCESKHIQVNKEATASKNEPSKEQTGWVAPDTMQIDVEPNAALIRYGREIISHTANYFGPQGSVAHSSNGMNCQNCHLDAGTKLFGNNYSAVASLYPKFRERSGTKETIAKRVNDCFERSLNGKPLDTTGKTMQSIIAYLKWLGKDVPKNKKPIGAGLTELAFMARAADPAKGEKVYLLKCKSCHAADGAGKLNTDGIAYQYPPLWGKNSYTNSAGLFRLSRFAGFIKSNMPLGATAENSQLSDEEAWDVAAFVNSRSRPEKNVSTDWPEISSKPVDYPYGPYADSFSAQQHKYGPFEPIVSATKNKINL